MASMSQYYDREKEKLNLGQQFKIHERKEIKRMRDVNLSKAIKPEDY